MTESVVRDNLKIIHKYNFDGPHCEDSETDTNIAIINLCNTLLRDYSHLIKSGYSFILDYNEDIYTYLALRLIRNFTPLTTVKPTFYYCGVCESPLHKRFLGDITSITVKKAQKMKKAILITGYHPICNVKIGNDLSKYFKTIVNPLERFTPNQLIQLQEFYLSPSDPFYDKALGHEDEFLLNFFQYPVGDVTGPLNYPVVKDKRVIEFKLSGTKKDFRLYNQIVRMDAEDINYVFIYNVDDEYAAEFITTNLNPYLSRRNTPNQFNIVYKENRIFHPEVVYHYIDFMEESE